MSVKVKHLDELAGLGFSPDAIAQAQAQLAEQPDQPKSEYSILPTVGNLIEEAKQQWADIQRREKRVKDDNKYLTAAKWRYGQILIKIKAGCNHGEYLTALKTIGTNYQRADEAIKISQHFPSEEAAGQCPVRRAMKLIKKAEKNYRNIPPMPKSEWPELIEIHHADFRHLRINDKSVGLILTDPPYVKEFVPLLRPFADWARKKLKPDGVVAFYYGICHLDAVFRAFADWQWITELITLSTAGHTPDHNLNILYCHKSILLFGLKEKCLPNRIMSVLPNAGKEKDWHPWQQPLGESLYLLKNLSGPNDLIVDPFGGGFTTAVACLDLGRKCITGDVDRVAVERGKVRVAEAAMKKRLA